LHLYLRWLESTAAVVADAGERSLWERSAVRTVGPRGGFKYVSYEHLEENGIPCHVSNGDRQAAEELIEFFRRHGIEIREERLK
jgi:hypothetical protein